MQHIGTRTIETPRLILRRSELFDALAMYQNWANDPEVTKFLTWPPHESVSVTKTVLASWAASYEKDDFYQWAIVPKGGGDMPIGSISVVHCNNAIESAEVGYCIGQAWWRQGFTAEALMGVLQYLFEEVGFNRIEARHDTRNPGSGMVMRHCGMIQEALMRQAGQNNLGICDIALYTILRQDWDFEKHAPAADRGQDAF